MIIRRSSQIDAKLVMRTLARFIAPDVKAFSEALITGDADVAKATVAITGKLTTVAVNWARNNPANDADLSKVIPIQRGQRGFPRLPDDVVDEIMQRRRSGQSRRQIAQAVKRPTTSISNVLKREGDPAPEEVKARERDIKTRTIAKLTAQLRDMKQTDEREREQRRNAG